MEVGGGWGPHARGSGDMYLVHAWWVGGLEAGRCVSQDVEVGSGWGPHARGPHLLVHLVVHQAPLLQEGMNPGSRQNRARGREIIQEISHCID